MELSLWVHNQLHQLTLHRMGHVVLRDRACLFFWYADLLVPDFIAADVDPSANNKTHSARGGQIPPTERFWIDSDIDSDADSETPRIDVKRESARIGVPPGGTAKNRDSRINDLQKRTSSRNLPVRF